MNKNKKGGKGGGGAVLEFVCPKEQIISSSPRREYK